jgi:hypothetical protein
VKYVLAGVDPGLAGHQALSLQAHQPAAGGESLGHAAYSRAARPRII